MQLSSSGEDTSNTTTMMMMTTLEIVGKAIEIAEAAVEETEEQQQVQMIHHQDDDDDYDDHYDFVDDDGDEHHNCPETERLLGLIEATGASSSCSSFCVGTDVASTPAARVDRIHVSDVPPKAPTRKASSETLMDGPTNNTFCSHHRPKFFHR
jgi:hypothetical protein